MIPEQKRMIPEQKRMIPEQKRMMKGGQDDGTPDIVPEVINQPFIPNNPFNKKPYQPRPEVTPGYRPRPEQEQSYRPRPEQEQSYRPRPPQQQQTPYDQPTIALQYYQPQPPPMRPMNVNYVIPLNRNMELMNLPTGMMTVGEKIVMPIQKVTNIYAPGPTGGHSIMTKYYEDMIPNRDPKLIFSTLGERIVFYNYLKRIMMTFYEGENIGIGGRNTQSYYDVCKNAIQYTKGQKSILEFLKVLNVNPNKYSLTEKNPYLSLPKNLLIMNTCYPITFDEASGSAVCAKNSVGIQIRIYALNKAEYTSYAMRDPLYKKYDVWRELLFYEKIREDIIKKKICPHFPINYGHFTSVNEQVDFGSLSKRPDNERDRITTDYQIFLFRDGVLKRALDPKNDPAFVMTPKYIWDEIITLPDEIDPSLQKYSGQCLLILTEAPTYNIYMWASKQYNVKGIAHVMTRHGYHMGFEWMNVLFQVAVAMAVMQKERIYINDMKLEDNVYIKDLHTDGNNMGYWRYVINGKSYYLPNIGYLAMIDSNYKDINKDGLINEQTPRTYKLAIGDLFGPVDKVAMDNMIYDNFKSIFNPNNFSPEFLSNNVNALPDEIIELLKQINLDTEKDITKIISKYFTDFFHDRIGTNLDTKEISNLKSVNDVFKTGELVAYTPSVDNYVWVMVDEVNLTNATVRIFNRVTNPMTGVVTSEYSVIPMNSLRQYPSLMTIDHVFKVENRIIDGEILETYIF